MNNSITNLSGRDLMRLNGAVFFLNKETGLLEIYLEANKVGEGYTRLAAIMDALKNTSKDIKAIDPAIKSMDGSFLSINGDNIKITQKNGRAFSESDLTKLLKLIPE